MTSSSGTYLPTKKVALHFPARQVLSSTDSRFVRTGSEQCSHQKRRRQGDSDGREWARRTGPATTAALVATYVGAFALSHPLAKRIGPRPSVLAVSALTAAVSYAAADRR